MEKEFEINSLVELEKIAEWLNKELKAPSVILLHGTLGTGKTAFCKKLVSLHGLPEAKVKSPTFSLINEYKTGVLDFFHLDLYRLERQDQFLLEEIKEILQNNRAILLIEWPEKLDLEDIYPLAIQIIEIDFRLLKNNFRKIRVCVKNLLNQKR